MRKSILCYSTLVGFMYAVYGLLQAYNGVATWFLGEGSSLQLGVKLFDAYIPNAFPDPFSGLALATTGLMFLSASYHGVRGFAKYKGYLFAAWLLSTVMLVLNVVELLASVLDAYYPLLYGGEPNYEWSLASDAWGIAPHLLLGILALPVYLDLEEFVGELLPETR